ncbi:MAG TPA: hypothetical protein VI256_04285, partial [Roseiarcus sp.]
MTEATRGVAPISDKRATTQGAGRGRRQGAGLDLILPYLLLAPSVLTVFGVLVYPLWNGLQTSTKFYRYGKAVSDIGLDNYRRLWSDPEFLSSLWVTLRFVTLSVAIETVL